MSPASSRRSTQDGRGDAAAGKREASGADGFHGAPGCSRGSSRPHVGWLVPASYGSADRPRDAAHAATLNTASSKTACLKRQSSPAQPSNLDERPPFSRERGFRAFGRSERRSRANEPPSIQQRNRYARPSLAFGRAEIRRSGRSAKDVEDLDRPAGQARSPTAAETHALHVEDDEQGARCRSRFRN